MVSKIPKPPLAKRLSDYIAARNCTLAAVGPVSRNCTDAVIELSNEYSIPIFLIASRRQVDSEKHGGGYVQNWTTRQFADYVKKRDRGGRVLLARDHGGPWQNNREKEGGYSLQNAMESAKQSYQADIDAGFDALHLDPSIDIFDKPGLETILLRLFELYEFCAEYAQSKNRDIIFEVGTEEQNGDVNSSEDLSYLLRRIREFCDEKSFAYPSFVVVQTGTRVIETENDGMLETLVKKGENGSPLYNKLSSMVEICNQQNIHIKAHNADYLSDKTIRKHPEIGIHAANIAPEFGVTESRALVQLLESNDLQRLADRFLELSYQSRRWEKWMKKNSQATDREKAIISGHYVFSDPVFTSIKEEASQELSALLPNIDDYLKNQVKKSMQRYLKGFRLI